MFLKRISRLGFGFYVRNADQSGACLQKFFRGMKKSSCYDVKDVAGVLPGRGSSKGELRPGVFLSVDDVSFELWRGECLSLIGPNGAGKSTLLKMLNGLVEPDRGWITIRGRVGVFIELGGGLQPHFHRVGKCLCQ
jgi:lipopolysaccharide transport system ATP-binding protein